MYHVGMDKVMPMTTPYYPRRGNDVTILYGEPISYWHLLEVCRDEGFD